jgi:hypothetical protein
MDSTTAFPRGGSTGEASSKSKRNIVSSEVNYILFNFFVHIIILIL